MYFLYDPDYNCPYIGRDGKPLEHRTLEEAKQHALQVMSNLIAMLEPTTEPIRVQVRDADGAVQYELTHGTD